MAGQTQRGQSPEGQTSPARSEAQRGQSPEGHNRPSEVRALRARQDPARSEPRGPQDPARSEPSVSVKSRHETVPQPEGQSANRPVCLVTQPSPVSCHRPRASRSSSRGRGVGLVFLFLAPSFSSLFFRFSVLVSRGFLGAGGARLPLRPSEGLAGVVVPHLLVAVRFPPTCEGSGTRGSGRRPKNRAFFQVSLQYFVRSWVLLYLLGCSGTSP